MLPHERKNRMYFISVFAPDHGESHRVDDDDPSIDERNQRAKTDKGKVEQYEKRPWSFAASSYDKLFAINS